MKRKVRAAADFLSQARAIVRERAKTHGCPLETHARIATMWNAYLTANGKTAKPITPVDVATMLLLLKIARQHGGIHNPDNALDILGYAAIAAEIEAAEASV